MIALHLPCISSPQLFLSYKFKSETIHYITMHQNRDCTAVHCTYLCIHTHTQATTREPCKTPTSDSGSYFKVSMPFIYDFHRLTVTQALQGNKTKVRIYVWHCTFFFPFQPQRNMCNKQSLHKTGLISIIGSVRKTISGIKYALNVAPIRKVTLYLWEINSVSNKLYNLLLITALRYGLFQL